MSTPEVFISYSHKDQSWKDQLLSHLSVSLDPDALEAWDDTRIPAGSAWEEELQRAMSEARIAILLISANYLSSKFVREVEVPALLDRSEHGMPVLPILVRPCAWKTVDWLQSKELLPGDNRALSGGDKNTIEADLAKITEEVHRQLQP